MQYNPKLKVVMAEILQLLKANDIAGTVALHMPGFGEYGANLSTSYSCAKMQNGRVVIDHKDPGKYMVTSNMLHTLVHAVASQTIVLMNADENPIFSRYKSSVRPNSTDEQQNN